MDDFEILFYTGSFLYHIAYLIILIAAIILITKHNTIASKLLLIASILIFVFSISEFIIPFLYKTDMNKMLQVRAVSSILSSMNYILFSLGLLLLAIDIRKMKK